MILTIRHETAYRFDRPVARAVQYLRIWPKDGPLQRILDWTVDSPVRLDPWTDGHGNKVLSMALERPASELRVVARGRVETFERAGVHGAAAEPLPPGYWLRGSRYCGPAPNLRALADDIAPLVASDRLVGLHALLRAVRSAVLYRSGATDVETDAATALERGAGVCQDHAHIFIAVCRLLGVPARYVGGYLAVVGEDPDGAQGHAWAEAWAPDLGWIGFDPSNGISPDTNYVRAAIGLDYEDAAPVRGIRMAGGAERIDVTVTVTALDDPAAAGYKPSQNQ